MKSDNKGKIVLNEADSEYWNDPSNHALIKEDENGLQYYTIFTIKPQLMMMLCDDFDYALALSKKMLQNGVRVFDSFSELYKWSLENNAGKTDE